METIVARDYEGPDDLARIAGLISDAWLRARPNVPFTIVTLEWLMAEPAGRHGLVEADPAVGAWRRARRRRVVLAARQRRRTRPRGPRR